jgi:hypothetical protein
MNKNNYIIVHKITRKLLPSLGMVLLVSGIATAAGFQTTTYLGYNSATGTNDRPYSILYQFPDPSKSGSGPYPLFMWTPGTFQVYSGNMSTLLLNQMSARGFVAAAVQYDNRAFSQNCNDSTAKAKSIYDATRSTSAMGVMCSIAGVNCAAGVVTMGISQGGAMAILAKNYAPDVRSTLAMSITDTRGQGDDAVNFTACTAKPNTAIPADRLMIINGLSDPLTGGQVPVMRVSGIVCGQPSQQCWSASMNGAGWYLVRDFQVVDGFADHCYMLKGGCFASAFDDNWLLGTDNWEMKPNLDWLASFGTVRQFSLQ